MSELLEKLDALREDPSYNDGVNLYLGEYGSFSFNSRKNLSLALELIARSDSIGLIRVCRTYDGMGDDLIDWWLRTNNEGEWTLFIRALGSRHPQVKSEQFDDNCIVTTPFSLSTSINLSEFALKLKDEEDIDRIFHSLRFETGDYEELLPSIY